MPRPRKPTKILQFTGAYAKNPHRADERANEPQPNGPLGDAPPHFKERERAIWIELVGEIHAGVGCKADRGSLEQLCVLVSKARTQYETGGPLAVDEKTLLAIDRYRSKFGLDPSSRSKVAATGEDKPKEDSFAAV